jgi:UDP-N-acetylglucosamine--N-acetylmuramyl-(pentapeptide) pyrophosphoryl-undecaprenol N-acetylglucosamine transferase
MESTSPLILLAAGGTGGHVFPAEALARELLARGLRVAFVTDTRGSRFSDDLEVPAYTVRASALGKGLFTRLKSVLTMGLGVLQARRVLRKLRPAAVVGFGGYPSVPALVAAAQMGIPIALHEQNAIVGRANRALSGKASLMATSYPYVKGLGKEMNARLLQTGNPVRPAFAALRATPYPAPTAEGAFRLLVLGGSLGAHVFSDIVPQALALLPSALRERLIVSQQCRPEDLENARAAFAGAAIEADLASFFRDVPDRMAASHLVICRAGGSTVAELTALGRPAIFVPLPHGHAGEQYANAEAIAEAGGGWLIPQDALTPEALSVRLEALMTLPESLVKTAAAARAWGTVAAADRLADGVEELIGRGVKAHSAWMQEPDLRADEKTLALATRERKF